MDISTKIKELRKSRKLSQTELADILNTTQQHYSQYELGRHEPPLKHIVTLCKYYEISADWLLGIKEE